MSEWRHWPYLFPADDSLELLWDVLDRVPIKFGMGLDWTLTDKFMVAVADVRAAIYLRMAFDGGRLIATDGLPILGEHEVLVSMDDRAKCETLLRENCPAETRWFSVIVVHARTEAALGAFDEAYWVAARNLIAEG